MGTNKGPKCEFHSFVEKSSLKIAAFYSVFFFDFRNLI